MSEDKTVEEKPTDDEDSSLTEQEKLMKKECMQTNLLMDCVHARIAKQNKEMVKKNKILTLGRLIIKLMHLNPELEILLPIGKDDEDCLLGRYPREFYSYRGNYHDLSIGLEKEPIKVAEFLKLTEECLDKTFEGYKGGDFVMDESTPIWIAGYGNSSSIALHDIILKKEKNKYYLIPVVPPECDNIFKEIGKNPAKTLDYIWLDSASYAPFCLGAVACEHRGGWRAFAGIGGSRYEKADIENIKATGSAMLEPWARAMFPDIKGEYIR